MAHFVENSGWMFEHALAHDLQSPSADAASANETVSAASNETVHAALQSLWHQSDPSNSSISSARLGPVLATSPHALLHPLAGAGNGMPTAPILTIASNALTVTEGGSIALPISASATAASNASVTIKGLTGYETVTDGLDHKVFSGSSITLTAAEVDSGLSLSSSYSGPGRPVNTLTVTASETLGGHMATSASQTITVTDPPAPSATTGASGNPLSLVVTGDNLNGTDPQIEVLVDGTQIGGTYTVTADHSQGQTQTIQVAGNFDPSVAHQVQVKFINDAWDGQMGDGHDINVYVESISLNGTTIAGIQGTNTATNGGVQASNANEAVMDINGSLSFNVPAEPPAPSGSSSGNPLTLVVTGDNMHGTDPQIEVFVDGTQIGGTYTVTADHSQGQTQTIQVAGNFDPSVAHQVQVKFINDAWDGQMGDGHDVNVYVESISLNGNTIAGIQGTNTATNGAVQAANANEAVMDINGSLSFNVPADPPATSGSSSSGGSSTSGSGSTAGGSGGGTNGGSTTGILPQKIDGEWWWPFNPPTIATVQTQAPEVNYLSLVGAFANGGGGGNVNDSNLFNNYSSASALQADIAAWKASGRVVVGVIGGGGDSTVIANATDAAQFMAAAVPIIKQLGLQGVDFDLENTPDAASVASIITQLKADFGSNFIIAMSPRPFELRPGGVYRQVIQDAGINNIDLVQPQDYALAGDSLSAQQSYMNSDLSDWINGSTGLTIPANKLLIGSFDPAEGESLSTAIQTFQHYKGLYPTLRGGMFWETREDANQLNWQFASQLAQAEQ